jgi:tetratricopeptide (TPR) repeat protein
MDRTETSALLQFERLIPDSVRQAMRAPSSAEFLSWVQKSLLHYVAQDSPLSSDPQLTQALAFAWARALWNGLPSDAAGQKVQHMPDPTDDASCPCGSSLTFAQCCRHLPRIPPLTSNALWPFVLANIQPRERDRLLAGNRVPRTALIEFAAYLLDEDRRNEVIAVLEPRLANPERYHDEETAILLDLLCDAYGMSDRGARRKLRLLHTITEKAPRSPLRSEAWQRLATMYMDRGENERAWRAFHQAQHDHPHAEALSVLEVELLVAEHRVEEAQHRATFWAHALKRGGTPPTDPRLEFLYRVAADPVTTLGEAAIDIDGTGRPLCEWLRSVAERVAPAYELSPCEHGNFTLAPPPSLARLERHWHQIFPLQKPFNVQEQPFDDHEVWGNACEGRWCGFLREHPESFDSIDILDDIATALARHPRADAPGLDDLLLGPVLTRHETIVAHACPRKAKVALPWVIEANRPALRGLVRAFQWHMARNERGPAVNTAERLLELNQDDPHSLRLIVVNEYLRAGSDAQALALAERYPQDLSPETRFGAVLALLRLRRVEEAGRALQRARSDLPKTVDYLLPPRVRRPKLRQGTIATGGDDQAWLYRDEMRAVWQQTPGALEWLRAQC